jgi:predicted homoserine dehydrogenase-like protein
MIDTALQERERSGTPIRVGMVGAGFAARMVALHLSAGIPGLRLVAVAARSPEKGERVFSEAGITRTGRVSDGPALDAIVARGGVGVAGDHHVLCDSRLLDVVIEITGTVEYGAGVVLDLLRARKHVVLVNAELDATLGPVLKTYAARQGVVITNTDGDEPGVAMTLIRYLRSIGLTPVGAGNLKGLVDHRRNPETQRAFAATHGQDPAKVASFADGTKLAMEATVLANAAGFGVGVRGMHGPAAHHVREMAHLLPAAELLGGGIVDYALGAEPYTGAFVIVHEPNPRKISHMKFLKMGDGPFFVFYTPYHLPHIQIASTIARAVLFHDATVVAAGSPRCEVIAIAKRTLRRGDVLDGLGGFDTYGVIDTVTRARAERCLPMGLAGGCTLRNDIAQDAPLTEDDVTTPSGRTSDRLWKEQRELPPDFR